ncbi:PAAR domain-containing protein [Plebeiibacterium marinum]|uniref:PAAR domain-containing protein n=1 Tax=Plebeiibacterium marinum TaxID=2992111 RepID=A0AAE3MHQ3_9BACT|nr:PAAR domain-containing protein [Plebeiobacterium marinum]MCW3807934.1 PAAR domain-containing protein [Plebeiobacterium marinum]
MAGQPIATVGSMHICPLCSGTVPHVGGPVNGPGMPGVTVNGQVVAVMGDMCICVGPPDMIAQGSPGVTINGTPVATVGCMTAHAGQITQGIPGVTIGPAVPTPNASMPLKEIPFPEIKKIQVLANQLKDAVTGSNNAQQLKQAQATQERVKEEAKKHGYLPDITFSH